jgi:methylase of polypeptide subunit release factors
MSLISKLSLTALSAVFAIAPLSHAQESVADAADENINYDVPYVPTPQDVVDAMLNIAQVKSSDHVIDLGSGDGRIVITAAKKYGATALGVDLNPVHIENSIASARKAGVTKKTQFVRGNLFETDLSKATVITMYLLPSVNMELRPKLLDLKPGTRIVSHAFDLHDWKPDQHIHAGSSQKDVYFWIVPAKIAGTWPLEAPQLKRPIQVTLKQKFQEIEGTARVGGKTIALTDTQLEGERVWFSFADSELGNVPQRFQGTLQDGVLRGTILPSNQPPRLSQKTDQAPQG